MKSTKPPPPRLALSQRSRSTRSNDGHVNPSSPSQHRHPSHLVPERHEDQPPASITDSPSSASYAATSAPTTEDVGEDIDMMRRRMNEALALKQQQLSTTSAPSKSPAVTVGKPDTTTSSEESLPSSSLSAGSAKTIKAPFDTTPGTVRTPSYPFPRMHLKLHRGTSHRSAPSHKPFTLLSPTSTPIAEIGSTTRTTDDLDSSETSTPVGKNPSGAQNMAEDPNFPTPDLYDMILVLNSESGLDAWWANVSQILAEAYGAERASLAVPGDMTDLENVPWGQKATFNLYSSESSESSNIESSTLSEPDHISHGKRAARPVGLIESSTAARRPVLQTRHSIAGAMPEIGSRGARQRPPGPVRALSSLSGQVEGRHTTSVSPRLSRNPQRRQSSTSSDSPASKALHESSGSVSSTLRCLVHVSLLPLESESDPLIVRTGVSSLFGKRRPVVLTRAYSEEEFMPETIPREDQKGRMQAQMRSTGHTSQDERSHGPRTFRAFDEYEQPEPSPWSQSPAPSPAARPDPSESPFFAQMAGVDESAFEQNPPSYDYVATANKSLEAIGADTSKTIVHIPLLQPVPSPGILASSLRFPVAILSLLSSINPYPRNLRHSLTHLLPHLASSFSLAQQYSALQDRLRGQAPGGYGAAFGLGGTFSDEGSELELVAELSEQLARDKGKDTSSIASASSPGDRNISSMNSASESAGSTPFLEHLGLSSGHPATPGKSGMEMFDSYFSAKRQKGGSSQMVTTPGAQAMRDESPEKQRRSDKKVQSSSRGPTKKVAISSSKAQEDPGIPPPPWPSSIASESDNGDHSQLSDISTRRPSQFQTLSSLEKPLPELISQLMLNSVPLQLFLAKPKNGDLVWTNRKFDAFRSQGEERVRDPWKNVHQDDRSGLMKGWNDALKSGSQFTHYVRVKRFNSDSDFRWFIFRASTLLATNGRLLYWIGSFMDVHEQYMISLEASEREATVARDAKIRALADSIPQILFEAVEDEGIVAANQQWQAFSGQTLEESRGLGFARQVHRDDLFKCGVLSPADIALISKLQPADQSQSGSSDSSDKTPQPPGPKLTRGASWHQPDSSSLDRLIQQGVIAVEKDENDRLFYSTEIRLRSKGGEFRWFLVRLVKVESDLINSGRSSWYGTCTDIDIRKRLERELNQANKKLHQEMESKTKFFANMSHEIRTPLNGILGSMPWLVESSLDHDQRRTVDTIQNSSNNLRELVDNILDVTKVEAGKMALVYKWFHVRTLLEEIIDTISSRAIERGLELNYTVDANVPSTVRGDPFRLRQVLLNLMGNSVKFTEQGEIYTRCSIIADERAASSEPDTVLLSFDVVDTGRGFNQTQFQRIFQQFGQIDGGSSHDAGSGLGLFLSKQLVEMHGGQLSARSVAGEGSTFSFYIKVKTTAPGASADILPFPRPTQHRSSASITGSPRSRSDSKTPTMSMARGAGQSPGLSKFVNSPENQSPGPMSSGSSDPSLRSQSISAIHQSSMSSLLPTPESIGSAGGAATGGERQALAEKAMASVPSFKRSRSDNDGSGLAPQMAHPTTYSIVVICPADFARAAIKQHIEQVVPHQIAVNVTTLKDIGSFLDLVQGPASTTFTHIVLDLPASSDVMLFLRQMTNFTATVIPELVVITDHYQKRDIMDDYTALTSTGRRAYLVHKPVKPAVFAMIFDPAQLRNLSRDAARNMAQTNTDDFKNTAIRVKETIGKKKFRVLLVEDSDTNRRVILKYLTKVDLVSETATNGEECTEMVFSKPHGYYSLIICDIQMPKKNGYQACSEIRQWERQNGYAPLPIMALTANAMPEERAAAGQAGFTDYLTKPVNFNVLGTMMMNLLDPKMTHVFLRDRAPES